MNIIFAVLGVLALIIIVLGAFIIFYGITLYNRLITFSRRCDEAWSGILVQLKKRHDLVPNLVEVVKGYAAHEKGLLEDLAARRSMIGGGSPADIARDEGAFSGILGRVLALSEAYPELKANGNFLGLQKSMENIENDIQMARRYYNGSVRDYNILVESFPSMLVASAFKFRAAGFFELDPAEAAVPKV